MTGEQALREILRIEGRTKPLLQRTVGLTWMVWAVISGGIFVSYEAIGIASPPSLVTWIALGSVWLPWVLLGIVATSVLWRSLALVMPSKSEGGVSATIVATATFLAVTIGGLALVIVANLPINGAAFAMIAIGVAAVLVGGSGLTTDSRAERTFWTVGGVGLAVVALAIDLIAGRVGYDANDLLLVLGPVASTALLFGGGLYTTAA